MYVLNRLIFVVLLIVTFLILIPYAIVHMVDRMLYAGGTELTKALDQLDENVEE